MIKMSGGTEISQDINKKPLVLRHNKHGKLSFNFVMREPSQDKHIRTEPELQIRAYIKDNSVIISLIS